MFCCYDVHGNWHAGWWLRRHCHAAQGQSHASSAFVKAQMRVTQTRLCPPQAGLRKLYLFTHPQQSPMAQRLVQAGWLCRLMGRRHLEHRQIFERLQGAKCKSRSGLTLGRMTGHTDRGNYLCFPDLCSVYFMSAMPRQIVFHSGPSNWVLDAARSLQSDCAQMPHPEPC